VYIPRPRLNWVPLEGLYINELCLFISGCAFIQVVSCREMLHAQNVISAQDWLYIWVENKNFLSISVASLEKWALNRFNCCYKMCFVRRDRLGVTLWLALQLEQCHEL
jgi:hypothetical protein